MDTILLVAAFLLTLIQALSGLIGLSLKVHLGWLGMACFFLAQII